MITHKKLFFVLIVLAFASCKNAPSTALLPPPAADFQQPVTKPLKLIGTNKIDLAAIKPVSIKPLVEKFYLDKLPVKVYDSSVFSPFKHAIAETKFNYDSATEKSLDIGKLPSRPLKFKTYILSPPKLIKAGLPHLKNAGLSLFELGEAQGLQAAIYYFSLVDRDGLLWIATDKGLFRYDGENLALYLPGPLEYTNSMMQDSSGLIWIADNQGIKVLDINAGLMKKIDATGGGISDSRILQMVPDKNGVIWATTARHGINIIDQKTQTVKWLNKEQGLSSSQPGGITIDNAANIWIATAGNGISVIDAKHDKIKYLNKTSGLKSDSVETLLCDRKGRIWIGANDGMINVLDPGKNTILSINEMQDKSMFTAPLLQDNKGRVWLGTTYGIEVIDLEKRVNMHLPRQNGAHSAAMSLNLDSRNQVWIDGLFGLEMFSDRSAFIKHTGNAGINAMVEDRQGLIWESALPAGIDVLDRKTGMSRHITTKQGLTNDTIQFIKEINGQIFICTNGGLDIFDLAKNTITHLNNKQSLSNISISMIADRAGNIWIGRIIDGSGIDVYDPVKSTIKHLGKAQGLYDLSVSDMALDDQGNIWFSTRKLGINVINTSTWNIKYLKNEPGYTGGPIALLQGNSDDVWVGTYKGLYFANLKTGSLTTFTPAQGLSSVSISSLLEHNGSIYAGTSKGVTVLTPPGSGKTNDKKWKVKSFGFEYGLNRPIHGPTKTDMLTKDGLYWWGDAGITILDLSKKDTSALPLYIKGINIMDASRYFIDRSRPGMGETDTLFTQNNLYFKKGYTPEDTAAKQSGMRWQRVVGPYNIPAELQLPYNQNFIRFQFNGINLSSHDSTLYRYRLSGIDKDWGDVTTSTTSKNYFNLPPDSYTFEVTGKNTNQPWSAPAYFSFIINPPWWQTWWARILYVVLFAATVYAFVHYRSLQLIKEKRVLEHKVRIRTQEVLQQKEEIESQRDNLEKAFVDLKITQNQLIQSEKMASLGELTAGIAHEIQNPLNFVNNFSDVSRELMEELKVELNNADPEEAKAIADDVINNLEKIAHHGKRADSIVKGMLEHSRSRSGHKELTNINMLADEYLRLSYQGLRAKDKSFNSEMITHLDPHLPKITVVPQDIGRVLLNLFNNAFYAVNQKQKTAVEDYKPEVTISTGVENDQLFIKVKDNGIGVPDAVKEKIMQPFFTTKPTGEGTGLGLSLSYDMIVKGHGGSINFNSKQDEGSEFVIGLPIIS